MQNPILLSEVKAPGGTGVVMQPTSTDYTLVVQLIHRATLQESHGIISGDIDIPWNVQRWK